VALEEASSTDCPKGKTAMLIHGLFVLPEEQRRGIGRRLVDYAKLFANRYSLDGLLVKAQAEAADFFQGLGFQPLPVEDKTKDYAIRFWLPLNRETKD
jgi:GNAT superfamily N-acetyltransferase